MKIVLKDLTKEYPARSKGDPQKTVAVNHFDLEIPSGTLVGLLGPSGCGKSTTLHLISGLVAPTEGRIFFGETDITDTPPEQRGVGLVFQNYALYPHLTVLQNILFPLENLRGAARLSKSEMHTRAREAAALVQIEDLLTRKPKQLSGGQQQRVAIARALVKTPNVLLLDEPLSNLDARLRLKTREEIRRIQRKTRITTVFVTHDQEEAMSISDLIVVMDSGVIQQIGAPQEVYDDPRNLFVAKFLGTPAINVFDARLTDGVLFIGDEAVLTDESTDAAAFSGGEVVAAIRPEGFIPDAEGPFTLDFSRLEVMGRDISVVAGHRCAQSDVVRIIVDSQSEIDHSSGKLRFSLKPGKVYLFDKMSGERLRFRSAPASGACER